MTGLARGLALIGGLMLAGAGWAAPAWADKPQRIVSTNYCTDQILIRLVEPERIASLTFLSWERDATAPDYRRVLDRVKPNHGLAEEVLTLEPDLVVGDPYSARFASNLLRRLGHEVVLIPTENSFEEWYGNVLALGEAVGEPERARRIVADFKARLAALQARIPPGERPVYADLTVNNYMPGTGTLYTEVVNAGGFRTAGEYMGFSGYRMIPLEQLIRIPAELISASSQYENPPSMATQNLRHPVLRQMAAKARAAIHIPGRYIMCTTPETLDMVEMLVKAREDIDSARRRDAAP